MKRLFSIAVLCMLFSAACAQSDVTTFLGIPVDGTKPEMIQKLRAKGYTAIPNEEDMIAMLGTFNGEPVYIYVRANNNNEVFRIDVIDYNDRNEKDIKSRFNHLCSQFDNNEKYEISVTGGYYIPEKVKISREISKHKKSYWAAYHQKSIMSAEDSVAIMNEYYKKHNMVVPNKDGFGYESFKNIAVSLMMASHPERFRHKQVLFGIMESENGLYKIMMGYINKCNEDADGSEL